MKKYLFALLGILLMQWNVLCAQVPVDTTKAEPMSWYQAMRQTKYEWYVSKQARNVGDSIVKYQLPSGGWAKNQDWGLGPDTVYMQDCFRTGIGSTIDNGATCQELRFLAKMYYYTNLIDYRIAFLNGMEFLLKMQYENGGWPQYYPSRGEGHYSNHITFNDNAMVNVMNFLLEVSKNGEPYDMLWLPKDLLERCKNAYDKGVECILKCQIIVDGQPTVWCQQHDEVTFKPAGGRVYELPSFCGTSETANILQVLYAQPNQRDERLIMAIDGAIRWLENHKIEGKAIEHYTNKEGKPDIRLVDRPGAPDMWARFYDLISGEPMFCGRDGVPHKKVEEIEYERRTGYSWFGTEPAELIKYHSQWEAYILDSYKMEE